MHPPVSVIVPVLDEEASLRQAVDRILADDYPGEVEIVLAVGPSKDRTEQIAAQLADENPHIVVVANPSGRTPEALNRAIAASHHQVIVRVDAHGFLPAGYVSRVVELLRETGAANVGGVMVPEGVTPLEQAVARAMSSPLGIGAVQFHTGGEPGPADSVYLGTFRRDVLEQLGGFDEHFTRAQDWELNYRIRQAGHTVWFDPSLRVGYRPRGSFRALWRQFNGGGRWRREVMSRYPETASARYLAPPAAVVAVAVGTAAGLVGSFGGPRALAWGWVAPAGYALAVAAGSLVAGRDLPLSALVRLPAVVATMHGSWGLGFLRGGAGTVGGAAGGGYPVSVASGPADAKPASSRPETSEDLPR